MNIESLEIQYKTAKGLLRDAEIEHERIRKLLVCAVLKDFTRKFMLKLTLSAPDDQFKKWINMISLFHVSFKHEFTIAFRDDIIVGKTRTQQIYVEISHKRHTFGQLETPEVVSDMEPFLTWLYAVQIDGKGVERTIRDALDTFGNDPLYYNK